jgi:hypothetical protein
MTIEEIKNKINDLAQEHAAIDENTLDDFNKAEFIEWQANDLIIDYCTIKGYVINGFPTEKKKLSKEELDDEDYFCRERFDLYLDMLTYLKEDVAGIMWHFNESFWPGTFDSKEEYLKSAKERVECGSFYDVEI